MEYFNVIIDGSLACYQEINEIGQERFTDLLGVTVETPQEPISYIYRSWEIPVWGV
jgi:hypothetical protein